jgi:hypothetical protein
VASEIRNSAAFSFNGAGNNTAIYF